MDTDSRRHIADPEVSEAEDFVRELIDRAPSDGLSNGASGALLAWGDRRSFLRVTEDVARAVGTGLRRVPENGRPIIGPRDALVMEAEQAEDPVRCPDAYLRSTPGPRGPAIVCGFAGGSDPWAAARRLAALWHQPDVVILPQGRGWLADRIAGSPGAEHTHPTIGVLGVCGGVGTTTTALWVASRLLEDGKPPIVVDAVPGSTALESCVAGEPMSGLRWEDIARLPYRPEAAHIVSAVPAPHGLPILSSDPDTTGQIQGSGTTLWATIDALSHEAMPVVDLGAIPLTWSTMNSTSVARCSALLLLVPFTLRGLCQARAACHRWSGVLPVVPVGTGPRWCDVSDQDVAQAIGMPLAATIPHVVPVHDSYEAGRVLDIAYKRPLRRALGEIVDAVGAAVESRAGRGRGRGYSAGQQFARISPQHRRPAGAVSEDQAATGPSCSDVGRASDVSAGRGAE